MDWKALLFSEPALALYGAALLWVWNFLKTRNQWNTERWEGMIAAAFLKAEKAGLKTGNEKLDFALSIFGQEYAKFYKAGPSAKDLADAALDLARKAFEHKVSK